MDILEIITTDITIHPMILLASNGAINGYIML